MKKNRKKRFIIIAIVVILIGLSVVFSGGPGELLVTVEPVERRSIVETVSASGKIQPAAEVKIQSEVSGQIIELPVNEGDFVERGTVLVRINPDLYNSALSRAEAALNSARSNLASSKARLAQAEAQFNAQQLNYDRMKKLFEDKAISASEMDNATSAWETARAEAVAARENIKAAEFSIESAQATRNEASDNLRRTTITAPMSGTVTALTKEVGETVLGNNMMSGDVIMKISALELMEVNVEVNESDIVRIHLGDTTAVEIDAYQDEVFYGVVTEIGNTALNAGAAGAISMDQVTNFSVKVQMLRESYAHHCQGQPMYYSPFRPGMSATVEIRTARADQVIAVPIKAIASREDTAAVSVDEGRGKWKSREEQAAPVATSANPSADPFTVVFVYSPSESIVRLQVVKTGVQDDRFIEIKEGLKGDEQVVTGPYTELSRTMVTGDKVTTGEGEKKTD